MVLDVPVLVWALTTTPSATVVDVVLDVVVCVDVVCSRGVWVVFDGSVDSIVEAPVVGPVVGFVLVESVLVDPPVDALGAVELLVSSAVATPCPVAIAVPTPNATARPPTRPI